MIICLIPVFNRPVLVIDAVASVIAQTYRPLETQCRPRVAPAPPVTRPKRS